MPKPRHWNRHYSHVDDAGSSFAYDVQDLPAGESVGRLRGVMALHAVIIATSAAEWIDGPAAHLTVAFGIAWVPGIPGTDLPLPVTNRVTADWIWYQQVVPTFEVAPTVDPSDGSITSFVHWHAETPIESRGMRTVTVEEGSAAVCPAFEILYDGQQAVTWPARWNIGFSMLHMT